MSEAAKLLLDEIEAFLAAQNMAPGTFGRKTVNDGKLVKRLRAGKSVRIDTAYTIQNFMKAREARA